MKHFLSVCLALTMLFSLCVPAFATEVEEPSGCSAFDSNDVIEIEDVSIIDDSKIELQNIGDTQVLMQTDDGIRYLTLVDQCEEVISVTRAGTQRKSSKTYLIKDKNWLGQEKTVVAITATGIWMDDAENSYIISFYGDYTIYDDSFWCRWIDEFKHETDIYCTLVLEVSHGYTACNYMLNGAIYPTNADYNNHRLHVSIENYSCNQ